MKTSNFFLPFKTLWQHFVKWMASSSELEVWQELDRHGQTYCWHAYDPITGRSACFGSEEEIRIWIEECYYQQHNHVINL
jgi:hypothetical protein